MEWGGFARFLGDLRVIGADCPSIGPQRGAQAFALARNLLRCDGYTEDWPTRVTLEGVASIDRE